MNFANLGSWKLERYSVGYIEAKLHNLGHIYNQKLLENLNKLNVASPLPPFSLYTIASLLFEFDHVYLEPMNIFVFILNTTLSLSLHFLKVL